MFLFVGPAPPAGFRLGGEVVGRAWDAPIYVGDPMPFVIQFTPGILGFLPRAVAFLEAQFCHYEVAALTAHIAASSYEV